MSRRDALDRALGRNHARLIDHLGTTLEVYQPTETTDHSGTTTSYPASPTTTTDGYVASPAESGDVGVSGSDTDLDAVIYVDGTTSVTWTPYDSPGEGATEVTDTRTSDRYRVETKLTSHGDILALGVVGSDT